MQTGEQTNWIMGIRHLKFMDSFKIYVVRLTLDDATVFGATERVSFVRGDNHTGHTQLMPPQDDDVI